MFVKREKNIIRNLKKLGIVELGSVIYLFTTQYFLSPIGFKGNRSQYSQNSCKSAKYLVTVFIAIYAMCLGVLKDTMDREQRIVFCRIHMPTLIYASTNFPIHSTKKQ